jgi:hypothetical protein
MPSEPSRTGLGVALLLVTACTSAITSGPSTFSDREIVLIKHLLADVDSAPLRPSGSPLYVDPRWWNGDWITDSALLGRRAAIILRSGHDTITIDTCPGRWVPDASKAGCPDSALRVVDFSAILRSERDSQTVRIGVTWREVAPIGDISYGYRYSLRWDGHRWWTLRRDMIGIAE